MSQKTPYEDARDVATGITEWDLPDALVRDIIYECPLCKADHTVPGTPPCPHKGMERKITTSKYGKITYKEWCEKEQQRLGDTVVIDKRQNPEGVEMICLRRKA